MGTITMRAENTFEEMDKSLFFYTKEDLLAELDDIEFADKPEQTRLLPDLYHKLKQNDIPCEKKTDSDAVEYYRQVITAYYSDPENRASFETRIVTSLCKKLSSYPTPTDYLKRIADNCGDKQWKNDPLRMRLLKQFIVYGDFLKAAYDTKKSDQSAWIRKMTNAETANDVAKNLNDRIFDQYYNDADAFKHHACEAIKIANELASGIFWTNSVTIKPLYLLAICFGMTYAYPSEDEVRLPDEKTDIQKNLFRGFYINNPIGEKTNGSAIPSERGINYSNYAEMAYLYYIANDCGGLTAAEKIRRAEAMIAAVGSADKTTLPKNRPTQYYVDTISQFLGKSEEDAKTYLQEEFTLSCVLPTAIIKNKSARIQAYLRGFIHSAYSGASEENFAEKISDDLICIITESALNKMDRQEAAALKTIALSGNDPDAKLKRTVDKKIKYESLRRNFRNLIWNYRDTMAKAIQEVFEEGVSASQQEFQAVLIAAVSLVINQIKKSWTNDENGKKKAKIIRLLTDYLPEPDSPELTLYLAGYTAQVFSESDESNAFDAGVLANGIVNIMEKGDAAKLASNIRKFLPAAENREQACEAVYNAVVMTFGIKTAPFSIRETQNTAAGVFEKVCMLLKESIYNYESGEVTIANSIRSYKFSLDPLISEAVRMETEAKPEQYNQLQALLSCLRQTNSFFGQKSPDSRSALNVSRSHLLVKLMYLFAYEFYCEEDFSSLNEIYNRFKWFADPYLKDAFYEPVSQKRIFDVLCITALLRFYHNDRFAETD